MPFNDPSAPFFLYPTAHQQTALKKGNKRGKCRAIQIKQCKHLWGCFSFINAWSMGVRSDAIKFLPARTGKDEASSKPLSKMTLHFGYVTPLKINHLFQKTMSINQVFRQHEPHSYKKAHFHFTVSHKKIPTKQYIHRYARKNSSEVSSTVCPERHYRRFFCTHLQFLEDRVYSHLYVQNYFPALLPNYFKK